MIKDYKIKKINNEEVLYIELSLDMEFARLNARKKKTKLKKTIKKYIKKNKIDFKGTKVVILASGLIIGSIFLDNYQKKETPLPTPGIISILEDVKSPVDEVDNKSVEQEVPVQKEEIKNVEKETTTKKPSKETTLVKTPAKAPSKTPSKAPEKVTSSNNNSTNKVEIKKEEEKKPTQETKPVENEVMITLKRQNGQQITLSLDEYVIGVVASEMPASFHVDALKSQAIIARTYALKLVGRGGVITDTSSTQNYKDTAELKKLWKNDYEKYYTKIKNAVLSTKNMVITYQNELIDAVYHSTSNGKTENAENVWKNSFPYLVSVESLYDKDNPSFEKKAFISYEELSSKLKTDISNSSQIEILKLTNGGRVAQIKINDKTYTGVEIRNLLGLRSATFTFEKNADGLNFTTTGYGHGVGLSQYGANGYAKAGWSYEKIIKHYYQGVSLSRI